MRCFLGVGNEDIFVMRLHEEGNLAWERCMVMA